jgi:hypothetical protein
MSGPYIAVAVVCNLACLFFFGWEKSIWASRLVYEVSPWGVSASSTPPTDAHNARAPEKTPIMVLPKDKPFDLNEWLQKV